MDPIFKKLNFKAHSPICVVDAPDAFLPHVEAMEGLTDIHRAVNPELSYSFFLGFVKSIADLEALAGKFDGHLEEDATFWVAYPKKSSKLYKTDISRDNGWEAVGALGFEGVRQVAIDADWSALRFRQAKLIKSMNRRNSMALSQEGKRRTQNNK